MGDCEGNDEELNVCNRHKCASDCCTKVILPDEKTLYHIFKFDISTSKVLRPVYYSNEKTNWLFRLEKLGEWWIGPNLDNAVGSHFIYKNNVCVEDMNNNVWNTFDPKANYWTEKPLQIKCVEKFESDQWADWSTCDCVLKAKRRKRYCSAIFEKNRVQVHPGYCEGDTEEIQFCDCKTELEKCPKAVEIIGSDVQPRRSGVYLASKEEFYTDSLYYFSSETKNYIYRLKVQGKYYWFINEHLGEKRGGFYYVEDIDSNYNQCIPLDDIFVKNWYVYHGGESKTWKQFSDLPDVTILPLEVEQVTPSKTTDWTDWSACNCETSEQSRSRLILDCSDQNCIDEEIRSCDSCPDYSWTIWSAWSSCSRKCNSGERTRSRTCVIGRSKWKSNFEIAIRSAGSVYRDLMYHNPAGF